jgi:hypothetical protein
MATYSKLHLSGGSADGQVIPVAATATAGTLLHTSGGTDEIWLWVSNASAAAVNLTIEWGGVSDPADHMVKSLSIPANSPPILVVPGIILATGLVVRAFAGTTNVLNMSGFVNRIA